MDMQSDCKHRISTYLDYMQKKNPKDINILIDDLKNKTQLSIIKPYIEFCLWLARNYFLTSRKTITNNDKGLVKGIIMSFNINKFFDNPDECLTYGNSSP